MCSLRTGSSPKLAPHLVAPAHLLARATRLYPWPLTFTDVLSALQDINGYVRFEADKDTLTMQVRTFLPGRSRSRWCNMRYG